MPERPLPESVAGAVSRLAADESADPRHIFDDPLAVTHADAASYEDRLAVLQRWRARIRKEEQEGGATDADVASAVQALEQGAALRQDMPDQAPEVWGYGVTPKSRGALDGSDEDEAP